MVNMGKFYVYQAVFLAEMTVLIASTVVTWSSPMLPRLNTTNDNPIGRPITEMENSIMTSIFILGALFGAIVYGFLTSIFGRKTLLLSVGFPFFIFYIVLAWSKALWLIFVSRFGAGIGLGASFTVLPMYFAEVSSAQNRGTLSAAMAVLINIGMLLGYAVGPYVTYFWFNIILAIPPLLYIILFYLFAPESTYWVILKDREKAEKILKKLRATDDVTAELDEIQSSIDNKQEGNFLDILKNKDFRKIFFLLLGGFTFMQLTGTGIVATYNQTIFEMVGGSLAPELGPIIVGVVQLIATIVTSVIADRFPRKVLLIVSHIGIIISQVPFGLYFFLMDRKVDVSKISWLPLICLMIFVTAYNLGAGPILFALQGELLPPEIKGVAISWHVVFNWVANFVLTFLFNILKRYIGMGILFWIFACFSVLAIFYYKIFMIETKGKTLQEIQNEIRS